MSVGDVRIWMNGVELKPAPRWRMDQTLFKKPPPFSGPGTWTTLTPAGIDELEGDYAQRIFNSKSKDELRKIRAELKKEPRLHRRIKDNLSLNIHNYLRRK